MALSLSKLPWYGQVGAFVVLAGAGVGLFYNYYELPARADLASRQQQLKALRVDIDKGQAAAKKLPEFRAEVDEWEQRLGNLRADLPGEKDAADLLRRMVTVATQSNLTITGFKPAPIVTKEMHAEWPINLELEGNYHNLANFFDRLGKFTRIVNVSALDVKGKDKDKTQPNTTIAAKCVATTFVLIDKPVVPETKPGAKPGAKAKPAPPKKVA
jgi:type IV pilus assembly protein PilO